MAEAVLNTADILAAGGASAAQLAAKANLASPALTGNPTAPTQTAGDNSTKLATTEYVETAVAGSVAGVASFNARTGAVTLLSADVTGALTYTPLASGGALGTPSSGTLSSCTVDGTNAVGYRNIPQNAKTGAYTLLASDVGKSIPNTTGGWTVDNSVFAAGDVVVLYNRSGSDQTITQGSGVTLRLAGTATTGNRTLAQRGFATLLFDSASDVACSGPGVT